MEAAEQKKIVALARKVMTLSRDDLLVHLRFLDRALDQLSLQERFGLEGIASDGNVLFFDPVYVLKMYEREPRRLSRTYLHTLMHSIYAHPFGAEKLEPDYWNLATDIAVERSVLDLELSSLALETDADQLRRLKVLREDIGPLSAERIYRYFRKNPPTRQRMLEYRECFARDLHDYWRPAERLELTEEQWQQISRRIRAELNSFSQGKLGSETMQENLRESTRKKYDYRNILSRFTVMGETIAVNDEEFDYVYYTYGLRTYGNLPLVEPLEYREERKVREFVIAIDTSASCRGEIVRSFLRETYQILKSSESFFQKINLHIVQCDSQVQEDIKITSDQEFEGFLKEGKIRGYGATDFRPVFDYVEDLRERKEFENLKGLIYFTDGYGIYPSRMPDYDVIFAFLGEDQYRPPVPPWSIKVVLEEEALEEQAGKQKSEAFEETQEPEEVEQA